MPDRAEVPVAIESRDYWFKVVEMLQQSWALVDPREGRAVIFFVDDRSGVFDRMELGGVDAAVQALQRNGFRRLAADREAQRFLAPPQPPFRESRRPNAIYSSGRFWSPAGEAGDGGTG